MTRELTRESLYEEIDRERTWQDHRYGAAQKTRAEWVSLVAKWVGKLADAADRGNHEEFGRRLVQVAAIAVQAREKGWLESEAAEEIGPELVGDREEFAELCDLLVEDDDLQAMLSAKGVDVDALLSVGRPALTLTLIDGGLIDGGREP